MTRFFERAFVWTGGGVFAASLIFCTYSYLVRWQDGRAGGGWSAAVFDALLLGVFAVHHSAFARDGVKRWLAGRFPEGLLRSLYVWIAALLFIAVCALWRRVGGDVHDARGWGAVAHAAVQLLGFWFIVKSVATIDPLDLAGIRTQRRPDNSNRTPAINESRAGTPERLQVAGPYRFVRHPLYFGWLLIVFGAAHVTGDRLVFAGLTTLYLILAIPWEERSLTDEFGAEYKEYMRRVRWRLVPYVY